MINSFDERFHHFARCVRPRLEKSAQRRHAEAGIGNIQIAKIGKLHAATGSGDPAHIGWIDEYPAVNLAAEYRRDAARSVADLQNRHVFLRFQLPVT